MNEPSSRGIFDRPLVVLMGAMAQVGGLIVTQMPDLPAVRFCRD